MQIYIDQSSKIEYTSQDTVIAYSNSKQKSLLIRAKDKREIEKIFRQAGKPYIFIYKTFAILIYILIKNDLSKIKCIIIDKEYQGKEPLIKDFLLQIIRKKSKELIAKEDIQFKQIGKKNNAHKKALGTYQGKIKPDLIVDLRDIMPCIV